MKNISNSKKANVATSLLSTIIAIGIYLYYFLGQCIDNCSYQFMEGILDPLFFFFLGLTIITAVFLALPARYFKTWFTFILPVAVVLIFLHASSVSVYTSSIVSMSRAEVVRFDMFVLGVFSALYVIGVFAKERMMKKNTANKQ